MATPYSDKGTSYMKPNGVKVILPNLTVRLYRARNEINEKSNYIDWNSPIKHFQYDDGSTIHWIHFDIANGDSKYSRFQKEYLQDPIDL